MAAQAIKNYEEFVDSDPDPKFKTSKTSPACTSSVKERALAIVSILLPRRFANSPCKPLGRDRPFGAALDHSVWKASTNGSGGVLAQLLSVEFLW